MKFLQKNKNRAVFQVAAAVFIVAALHFVFMGFTGKHLFSSNPYNSYAKQCAAWLQGRLDLGQDYPWLELAVLGGKYYVSFPPFPSYLLLPFAVFFGENTPDSLLSFLVMLVGVAYAARIALRLQLPTYQCILLPVFLYCGSCVWQITVDGWVWFFAQNLSFTLTLMSLFYAISSAKARAVFCLCCAVGCRPFQIVYFPLLLLLLLQNTPGDTLLQKMHRVLFKPFAGYVPSILIAASYMLLNLLRFGSPVEFGHSYLPEFVRSEYGQFHWRYLLQNAPCLLRLPRLNATTGLLEPPKWDGMNVFLSFPILIWYLFVVLRSAQRRRQSGALAPRPNRWANRLIVCLAGLHTLLFLFHRTMGGAHFGNRYIADAMPAIFLAVCLAWQASRGKNHCGNGGEGRASQRVFYLLLLPGIVFHMLGVGFFYLNL